MSISLKNFQKLFSNEGKNQAATDGSKENCQEIWLKTDGGTCPSCAMTLEKIGPKLNGINSVEVDRAASRIKLNYDGKTESLDGMIELVRRIGYSASPEEPSKQA